MLLESLSRFLWRSGEHQRDERWTFELAAPGQHRPIAMVGERVIAVGEPFDFKPGEDMDLGALRSEPGGTLVLHLRSSTEHLPGELQVHITYAAHRHQELIKVAAATPIRLENLQPGSGKLTVMGTNTADCKVEFEVLAGTECVLDVELAQAVSVPYRIEFPTYDHSVSVLARFVERASRSEVGRFQHDDLGQYPNPFEFTKKLAPGGYRLEVVLGDGRRKEVEFDVLSLDSSDAPSLVLDLR